jgi:hypothetical protein
MKSIKILGILFLFLFCFSTVNAQWPPEFEGTGTMVFDASGTFALSVMCDGEEVDFLLGPGEAKIRIHYKNGQPVFEKIFGAQNHLVSQVTGEVFKVLDSEHGSYVDKGRAQDHVLIWHFKAKGNMGSMYIGQMKSLWLGPGLGYEILEAEVKCK